MLLADAAGRDHCLVKTDAPNAYMQGERASAGRAHRPS